MGNSEYFVKPHGGQLVNLLVDPDKAEVLKTESQHYLSITLTQRQVCDLELLMNGAFSPLTGFMNQADYESVVDNMRLADGTVWPVPIVRHNPSMCPGRPICKHRSDSSQWFVQTVV